MTSSHWQYMQDEDSDTETTNDKNRWDTRTHLHSQ